MKKPKTQVNLAAIVCYHTNDYRFLRFCIEGLAPFCKQIIVPVCTHSYSGIPENQELLHRSYAEHPECQFVEFAYDPDNLYGINRGAVPDTESWLHYWHSTARYVGWHFLRPEIEHIVFIDVDEICDGGRVLKWLDSGEFREYKALLLSSYQYFREPSFRSTTNTNMVLMMEKASISPELIFNDHERPGIFFNFLEKKKKSVRGLDNRPMVHHYSWVRPKDEIVFKVRNWGHRYDKDWEPIVEEEFSRPFRGTEQFCGYKYRTVKPVHPILEQDVESLKNLSLYRNIPQASFPNLTCVNAQDISQLNIQKVFLTS